MAISMLDKDENNTENSILVFLECIPQKTNLIDKLILSCNID